MTKPKAGNLAKAQERDFLRKAEAALHAGRMSACERHCQRVLKISEAQPEALHTLALVRARRGSLKAAIDLAQKALAAAPADVAISNTLANLLYENDDIVAAEQQWRQTLTLDPQHLSALYNLGLAQLLRGHQRVARAMLAQAAALAPDDAEVQVRYARTLAADGELNAAARVGARATQLAPRTATIWNEIGKIHATGGDFEHAKMHYRTALKLAPGYAAAALHLSKVQRFTAVADGSAADADALLIYQAAEHVARNAHWREQRDVRYALGKLCDDRGDVSSAFAHYCTANGLQRRHAKGTVDDERKGVLAVRKHFDATLFQRLSGAGCADPAPIFIVGMPRSGTTLVEQILAAHPHVHGGGELQLLDQIAQHIPQRCGYEKPYPACASALSAADCATIGDDYVRGLRSHAQADSAFITDKMPANYLHLGLIALCLPAARIVWCERDALDNGLSLFFTDFAVGHLYTTDLAAIGAMIGAVRALRQYWVETLPIPIFRIEYEALVRDPERCTRELLKYCGLGWHPDCQQPHRLQRDVNTASAWQVRQPIYTDAVARWKRYQEYLAPLQENLAPME